MTAEDMTPEDLWKRYAAIWFLDAERRPGELAACLADDASYCDPQHAAGGREALSAYMADVQQRVPCGRFEIRSVQHHHGRCLAQWELLSADDGLVLTGTSFAIANPLPPAAPIPLPVAASAQWTFSDRANDYALFLQQGMPVLNATAPISGTYLPRTFTTGALPAPAPAALESQLLSSQVGRNPNGNWQLFVNQQTLSNAGNPQPTGTIAGGWCVDVTTTAASTGCYASQTLSGSIDTSDLTQTGRINRNGVPSLCTWPKTNSLFATTVLHYDAFAVVNPAPQESCITFTSDFGGCGGSTVQPVVYTSFDPANPGNNVLADAGYSSTGRIQMSFRRGAGQPFTVVVHEITANSGCPAYTLQLEQNPCLGVPIGDLIFRNGFD